ncbi:MAG: response regulator, partial [Anaerolineales bacterium]|nr:response regulator [Anaerolineales bacterium]
GSGEEALAQVGDYRPDLILCDVMLPGIDGYGILLELQQQPELATIPFIFLTAKSTYADIRKGMDLG